MMDFRFIKKECIKCKNIRKFVVNTPRDKENTCGNCWDWEGRPELLCTMCGQAKDIKEFEGPSVCKTCWKEAKKTYD